MPKGVLCCGSSLRQHWFHSFPALTNCNFWGFLEKHRSSYPTFKEQRYLSNPSVLYHIPSTSSLKLWPKLPSNHRLFFFTFQEFQNESCTRTFTFFLSSFLDSLQKDLGKWQSDDNSMLHRLGSAICIAYLTLTSRNNVWSVCCIEFLPTNWQSTLMLGLFRPFKSLEKFSCFFA